MRGIIRAPTEWGLSDEYFRSQTGENHTVNQALIIAIPP